MAKLKPTQKQCSECNATIALGATRCRYCKARQLDAEAVRRIGQSMILLGCALPFLAIVVAIVVVLALGTTKS